MMRRGLLYVPLVIAAALVVVLVLTGGTDYYKASVLLDNAGGLRSGSPVVIGGVPVGKVDLSIDPKTKMVLVDLNIDKQYAPLGKDSSAEIVAQNLLGQKQLSVDPGKTSDPAPSGFRIPTDRVQVQADLDQVLNVLDASTRARLSIFVNEAGSAFVGRREDFNALLLHLSPVLGSGRRLLSELGANNAAVGRLIDESDRYVATTTAQRDKLVALLDRVGQTSETVAARRAELRETLAAAPPALATLRSFLGRLQDATVPLGPAADKLAATAGPLLQVQAALPGFTAAARPTLDTAAAVAPSLTRLANGATPVLRRSIPALAQLRRTSVNDIPGVAKTLNGSIYNVVAVLENWSRAIQYRDGLSHIFRGEAS
ncbi:MAG: phospholipid/cholesterol/gamma-HCH transport system substrate-binding protein, partial [Solirubrobacteraceae bacterium]|nr:phospholipid/cholesterol/gamma-HCH transport system substrate-binding protein [Solirubrobacteraceae bacterium]